MTDWSLNPVFGSYGIVVLVGFCLLAILLLVKESGRLTKGQSLTLWSIRLAMCLVLLLVLIRPGITLTTQSTPSGTVAILIDETASMALPSGDGTSTRWEEQTNALESLWSNRGRLDPNNSWSVFSYETNLKPIGAAKGHANAPLSLTTSPTGSATDVAGPLSQLMSAPTDSPLSAVVWMGDGSQTLSPSGGDPLQMARRLAQLDVPLYVVGIGPRGDSDNSRDLSLEGVPEQLDVFTQNPFNILGSIRCRGVANQEVAVRLLVRMAGRESQELTRVRVRPTRSDEVLPFQLKLVAPTPGAYELIVEAVPVEREAVIQNNVSTVYLNVRAGGARVLYIEGEARFEMKFIRRSLGDSPDIDLSALPINKPPVQKWPVDLSEIFARDVFDCVILGDVDFNAFGQEGATRLAEMVRGGTGLITLGGYYAYGPGGWGQSALKDILPVQLGTTARNTIEGNVNLQEQIPGPIQVIPKGNPELLQIDAPENNLATWRELKPLLGASRWEGVKNVPGTVLLAESAKQEPLIVAGSAGEGRVISMAVDSTFLWVRQGKAAEHKAFWRKLVYWAMRRKAVNEGLELRMPQRRLLLDQSSECIIDWIPGSAGGEMPQNVVLHLWKMPSDSDGTERDVGPVPTNRRDSNSIRASFPGTKEPGRYEWRARATSQAGTVVEGKLPFEVSDRSLESLQPIPDWQMMEQMARLNAGAGGGLYAPSQISEILTQLQDRRKQSAETLIENRKLGEGLLDTWTAFLILGALMIGQWSLRKKWNLP